MKSSNVKTLFNKYIKQHLKLTDFRTKGHMIYSDIQQGLLKGFYFNTSAFSADQFEIVVFVLPLYVPIDFIGLSFGYYLKTPSKRQWWTFKEDSLEQLGQELSNVINQASESFLSKLNNAVGFYNYYKKEKKNTLPFFEAVAYSAAYAELKVADKELKDLISYIEKKENTKIDWVNEVYRNTEVLLMGDRSSILLEWEEHTRKALKI